MPSLKPTVVGLGMSMPFLATISVWMRIKSRRLRKAKLGADDYTIFIALIFAYGLCITLLIDGFSGNAGGHLSYEGDGVVPDLRDFVVFSKTGWCIQFISVLGLGFTKISVLLLYRRIFIGRMFRATALVFTVLISMWMIAFFFANLIDCLPFEANWKLVLRPTDHCVDILQLFWGLSISDIITDVMILTLPWYQIWKLQMPLRQKALVCGIFLLGGFVVGAGIARFVFIVQATRSSSLDYTYERAPSLYWTVVEVCIGVVSACLPTIRPLISGYSPKSIVQSIRNRLGSSQSRLRFSDNSFPLRHSSVRDVSTSSLVRSGLHEHNTTYHAQVDGTALHELPKMSILKNGIAVSKPFSNSDGMV